MADEIITGTLQVNGSTGIGTSPGNYKLLVHGNALEWAGRFRSPNGDSLAMFAYPGGNGLYVSSVKNDTTYLMNLIGNSPDGVGGTSRLYVQSAGNVGIGTTSPGEKLEVSGNIKLSGNLLAGTRKIADSGGCYYAD